jgi:hypothetical protein
MIIKTLALKNCNEILFIETIFIETMVVCK